MSAKYNQRGFPPLAVFYRGFNKTSIEGAFLIYSVRKAFTELELKKSPRSPRSGNPGTCLSIVSSFMLKAPKQIRVLPIPCGWTSSRNLPSRGLLLITNFARATAAQAAPVPWFRTVSAETRSLKGTKRAPGRETRGIWRLLAEYRSPSSPVVGTTFISTLDLRLPYDPTHLDSQFRYLPRHGALIILPNTSAEIANLPSPLAFL